MADEDRWYRKAFGNIWASEGKEFPSSDHSFKMRKTSIILKLEKQRQESLIKMKEFEEKIASDEWKKRRLKDGDLDSVAKKLKGDPNSSMKIKIKNLRLDKEQTQEVEQWDGRKESSASNIGDFAVGSVKPKIRGVDSRYVENNFNSNGVVNGSRIAPSNVVDQPIVPGLAEISKSIPRVGAGTGAGTGAGRDKQEIISSRDKDGSNYVEVGNSSVGSSQTAIQPNLAEHILSSPEKAHVSIPKVVSPAPSIGFSGVRFNMGNLQKRQRKEKDTSGGDGREPTGGIVNSAKVDSVGQEPKTYSEKTLKSIQSQLKI
ncbi:hypothetical protein CLIB1423_20S00738 [[Candida] railenensis]|uniref:Uncharacterized protein n=1 Tax=[Candida] railenensis TaxID=45579 RepID=A0A9P0QSU2_9ASCO|nr:hypothetical protein CLIB1423_20S00738 [[Candida] railenensis]